MDFYERLRLLCKEKNTSVTTMLQELGMSTGCTGNWKKGQLPKGDVLVMIANYLDTSIDYIILGKYFNNLTHDERKLIKLYQSTPECAKYKVLCDFEKLVDEEIEKLDKESGNKCKTHSGNNSIAECYNNDFIKNIIKNG